jgi:hypothetical protein
MPALGDERISLGMTRMVGSGARSDVFAAGLPVAKKTGGLRLKAAVWRLYVHVPAWTVMAQIVCQDTEGGKKSVVLLTLAA